MFDQNAPISSPDAGNDTDAGVNAPSAKPARAREILGAALPQHQTSSGTTNTTPPQNQPVVTTQNIQEIVPTSAVVAEQPITFEPKHSPFRAAIQAVFGTPKDLQERLLTDRRKRHPKGADIQAIIIKNAKEAFAATTPKKAA